MPAVFLLVFHLIASSSTHSQPRFLENGGPLAYGSESGFILDSPTREKIDLNGSWMYDVDGGQAGSVLIPSSYDFVGKVRFSRNFTLTPEQVDKYRFHLVMYGVNYNCEVSINGDFITNHIGGYTSFVSGIPPNTLQAGDENIIRVVTDNQLDARRSLPLRSQVWGWKNYGGILRDVFLLATPQLYIDHVVVTTATGNDLNTAEVSVTARFDGQLPAVEPPPGTKPLPGPAFYVEIVEKVSGTQVAKSQIIPLVRSGQEWQEGKTKVTFKEPRLWSPATPDLYVVRCFIVQPEGKEFSVIDQYDVNSGIRTIAVTGGDILLNGRRIVLKGVIWQEDHPVFGASIPYEELEKDVVLIKNLGANLIRFGHRPPHPYMLNLCDRYGLLAMEEIPVTKVPASVLADDYFVDLATVMMKEMVLRDRNHPSVLAWGIGDEFESSAPRARDFVQGLARVARSLDSRPLYYGSRLLLRDACTDLVELAAVNIHTTDLKQFRKDVEDWQSAHAGKPVIAAKFGTEVQHGNQNGYSDPLSYEAQARFYQQRFDVLKSLNYDGGIVWSFNDWQGDRPALTVSSGDPRMHTLGLVSERRQKRLAYDAVRAIFGGEKFVALPIGSHTESAPIIFVLSGLVVLIGAAYFYNASRRFRDSLHRSVMNAYNFFADVRDQRIVSILHSSLLGMIVSAAFSIVTASVLFHFRQDIVLDNLLSYLLITDEVKETVVYLIWDPPRFILYGALFCFLGLLLISLIVRLSAPVFRTRVQAFHAYTVTMWSTPPLLILVPVGMILYRVLESEMYVLPSLALIAALVLWVLLRFMKGVAIVFDAFPPKVYAIVTVAVVGLAALLYFYLDYTQSASVYLRFMYNTMTTSQ